MEMNLSRAPVCLCEGGRYTHSHLISKHSSGSTVSHNGDIFFERNSVPAFFSPIPANMVILPNRFYRSTLFVVLDPVSN